MMTETSAQLLDKLCTQALMMASAAAWSEISLAELCAGSGVSLSQCAQARLTKAHVADSLDRQLDLAMLEANPNVDHSQGIKDRLFDVLMARFDAMEEQRAAWSSIMTGEACDVLARLARRARRVRTGAWALEAAGVSATTIDGAACAVAVARILRTCDTVWLKDGPDVAKTMARLDQGLRSGEEWLSRAHTLRSFVQGNTGKAKPEVEPTP